MSVEEMRQLHPPNFPHLETRSLEFKLNQQVTLAFIESNKRYQCLLMRIRQLNPSQTYFVVLYVWKGSGTLIFVLIVQNFVVIFAFGDGLLNSGPNALIAVHLCTFMS